MMHNSRINIYEFLSINGSYESFPSFIKDGPDFVKDGYVARFTPRFSITNSIDANGVNTQLAFQELYLKVKEKCWEWCNHIEK